MVLVPLHLYHTGFLLNIKQIANNFQICGKGVHIRLDLKIDMELFNNSNN